MPAVSGAVKGFGLIRLRGRDFLPVLGYRAASATRGRGGQSVSGRPERPCGSSSSAVLLTGQLLTDPRRHLGPAGEAQLGQDVLDVGLGGAL